MMEAGANSVLQTAFTLADGLEYVKAALAAGRWDLLALKPPREARAAIPVPEPLRGYEIDAGGETMCTHGPDAAPDDVDVRRPVDVDELRAWGDRVLRGLDGEAPTFVCDVWSPVPSCWPASPWPCWQGRRIHDPAARLGPRGPRGRRGGRGGARRGDRRPAPRGAVRRARPRPHRSRRPSWPR